MKHLLKTHNPGDKRCRARLTVDSEAGLAGVGGAKVVGDDALVAALVREGDVAQVEDGGVLHHAVAPDDDVGGGPSVGGVRGAVVGVVGPGRVLHVAVVQQLLVLAPGEGDGRGAAAGRRACEPHVAAQHRHRGGGLHRDLGLGEVIWRGVKNHTPIVSGGEGKRL